MVAIADRVRPDINMTAEAVATTVRSLRTVCYSGRGGASDVKHLLRLETLLKEQGHWHLVS